MDQINKLISNLPSGELTIFLTLFNLGGCKTAKCIHASFGSEMKKKIKIPTVINCLNKLIKKGLVFKRKLIIKVFGEIVEYIGYIIPKNVRQLYQENK